MEWAGFRIVAIATWIYVGAQGGGLAPFSLTVRVLILKFTIMYTIDKGGLTEAEWKELSALSYVLTWGYTDDYKRDLKRKKELDKIRG